MVAIRLYTSSDKKSYRFACVLRLDEENDEFRLEVILSFYYKLNVKRMTDSISILAHPVPDRGEILKVESPLNFNVAYL
jgi:hypothetical protein